MSKTVKSGTSPAAAIGIFLLSAVIILALLVLWKTVMPDSYFAVWGTPDEHLLRENADLRAKLNQTRVDLAQQRNETGTLRSELYAEKMKRFAWPVLIGVLIVGAVIAYLLWKLMQKKIGLTVKEALLKYEPLVRGEHPFGYGFDEERYPRVATRHKTTERVKKDKEDGTTVKTWVFLMEFEFIPRGEMNQYEKGVWMPRPENTVTVAITNVDDDYVQQWFPFKNIMEAELEMHRWDIHGYAIQKTRQVDDALAALQQGNSLKEIQKEYQDQSQQGDTI